MANPSFYKSDTPGSIEAQMSADFMYHRCTVVYFVGEVRSKQCNRLFKPDKMKNPGIDGLHPLEISCETVSNSNCVKDNNIRHRPPECGFAKNFDFNLLEEEAIDWSNPNANISINVTFEPILRKNSPKPLYHIVFYGDAAKFSNPQEVSLFNQSKKNV